MNPGDVVWKFGKHKDKAIKDTPRDYLEWFLGTDSPNQFMRDKVTAFLKESPNSSPAAPSGDLASQVAQLQQQVHTLSLDVLELSKKVKDLGEPTPF